MDVIIKESFSKSIQKLETKKGEEAQRHAFELKLKSEGQLRSRLRPLMESRGYWQLPIGEGYGLVVLMEGETLSISFAGSDESIRRWLSEEVSEGTAPKYQRALDVAVRAAREAGRRLREEFYRPGGPRGDREKAPMDEEVEAVIREMLYKAFPSYGIVAEESPEESSAGSDLEGHLWLVDPNDGTSAFHDGYRGATVSIGLLCDGVPVLGVVFAYAVGGELGDLLAWAEGCGSLTRNGREVLRTPWRECLDGAQVLVSHRADQRPLPNGSAVSPGRYRPIPGIAYRLALTAAGEGEVALSIAGVRNFDIAAGHALLRSQGGVIIDQSGEEVAYERDGALKRALTLCLGGDSGLCGELLGRPWGDVLSASDRDEEEFDLCSPTRGGGIRSGELIDRATGALGGSIFGDALGSLVAFQTPASILRQYPDGLRELVANQAWGILSGQPTDTSEMCLVLARSLVKAGGFEVSKVLAAYAWWYRSRPFDVDPVVERILEEVLMSARPAAFMVSAAQNMSERYALSGEQGNAALTRVAPIGVMGYSATVHEVAEWAANDAILTHAHPVCRDASVVLSVAIAYAIKMGRGASDVYAFALRSASELELNTNVIKTLENAGQRAPRDYTVRPNWTLVALQNAFHQLLFARSPEAGLVDTVMRGGDTDGNASVLGALMGATYGWGSFPARWRLNQQGCRPQEGLQGVIRPRPRACWPVDLPILAERLLQLGREEEQATMLKVKSSTRGVRERVFNRPAAPFKTSPSAVASYFYLDCERFFRFKSTREAERLRAGLPTTEMTRGPLMQELALDGYRWEETVLEKYLKGKVSIPEGEEPVHERHFTIIESLKRIKEEPAGRFIYQAMLRPPPSFYSRYGLDPDLLTFSDNFPDLIAVEEDPERAGGRLFRILDVKRGISMKSTYKVQILLYAMILEEVIRAASIEDARVDQSYGGVWLGSLEWPERCELTSIRPHLLRFMKEDLPRILQEETKEVAWHVTARCEWCDFFSHCHKEMQESDDLSRVSMLTAHGKRFLRQQVGVKSVGELSQFLKTRRDVDEMLSKCASLAGQRHRLEKRVEALQEGEVKLYGTSTALLSKRTKKDIYIYLTLQQEPLYHTIYLSGIMVNGNSDVPDELLSVALSKPLVFVGQTAADVTAVRHDFVRTLYGVLNKIHEYNTKNRVPNQISVQLFMHTSTEKQLLIRQLMESVKDEDVREEAMSLLLYVQGPELMEADVHPADPVSHPVVTMLTTVTRLAAFPIEVSYTLPEVMASLKSSYSYPRQREFHFPLGHGLRADPIVSAWIKGEGDNVDRVRDQGKKLLYALRSLMLTVREVAKENVYAWPPRFEFPRVEKIKDSLLSRLAFFAKYESYKRCLEVRGRRLESLEIQREQGYAIVLEAVDDEVMKLLGPRVELKAKDFSSWLLVPDTEEGREGQLTFDDYRFRKTMWKWPMHESRAVVGLASVLSDDVGFTSHVKLLYYSAFKGRVPARGERFLLYRRYTDFNTDRVVSFLKKLDRQGPGLFLKMLRDPSSASREAPLRRDIEEVALREEGNLGLTPSKLKAYRVLRHRRMVALWGPPGTGKTHMLAAMILGLSSAYHARREPFRVLVTAFTHAAIENLLAKISELQRSLGPTLRGQVRLGKASHWQGESHGDCVDVKEMSRWLLSGRCSVIGATVYACLKVYDDIPSFELVVVDEASQVRVPEASIPASKVSAGGRLVLAGDHCQLAPIVVGGYPDPGEGEPLLHRSVFEAVLSMSASGGEEVCQLKENFRMNDVLTSVSSQLLYPDYVCANEEVSARRLRYESPAGQDPLLRSCLDPAYPLVLLVMRGVVASRENAHEASLVADLVVSLREGLKTREGELYQRDSEFFREGVFVVSPHHSQLRLIRSELSERRAWSAAPFVDTVEKMQGQEADAVLVSYGVSDTEFALMESEFIYGMNRLNVSITRGRAKTIVFLSEPLLNASPQVLQSASAAEGLTFMRRLAEIMEREGKLEGYDLGGGVEVDVWSLGRDVQQ